MNGFIRLTVMIGFFGYIVGCSTGEPAKDNAGSPPAEDLSQIADSGGSDLDGGLSGDLSQSANSDPNALPAIDVGSTDNPPPEIAPPPEAPAAPMVTGGQKVQIKNIQFKPNDNGGTIVVEGDSPIAYKTRYNSSTNQFVIEMENASIPSRLTRPIITKDFDGPIGGIDAYQNSRGNGGRLVVQLKSTGVEPIVQAEGNSLLVVTPFNVSQGEKITMASPSFTSASSLKSDSDSGPGGPSSALLSYQSLEQFLSGNMRFSGKKISLETDENMDVRDVFRIIADEAGVNLILTEDVKGRISLKLRQVPWDQALVMVMRARKLSYTRTGNVLRIAPINDIRQEEDEAVRMAANRKAVAPLKVKLFPISYAKIEDLEKQIKPFLTKDRGNVVVDIRTSALVVSDTEDVLDRVSELIKSIDIPPNQVMIEGKVVEATETFERSLGVTWNMPGLASSTGLSGSRGAINATNTFGISTVGAQNASAGNLDYRLSMGPLDFFGNLDLSIAMSEFEGTAKVLSSPRIVTLHNEVAEINQTIKVPVLSTTTTPATGSQTSTTFVDVQLKLNVTPAITNDGSVIISVDLLREFLGANPVPGTDQRPINRRAAKAKLMVRNGQTAVLGGVYQTDEQLGENGVPGLSAIPFLGWLFKGTTKSMQKNELLIFLTPRILTQSIDARSVPAGKDLKSGGISE